MTPKEGRGKSSDNSVKGALRLEYKLIKRGKVVLMVQVSNPFAVI
jgi:hypothetical protein